METKKTANEVIFQVNLFKSSMLDFYHEVKHNVVLQAIHDLDILLEELYGVKELELKIPVDATPNVCIAAVYQLIGPRSSNKVHQAWTMYRRYYFDLMR